MRQITDECTNEQQQEWIENNGEMVRSFDLEIAACLRQLLIDVPN
ncbi:MAG: hypothetical protein Q7T82_19890 [Armatimonadota bacterium]|nr:hypothetical protein [Armatimonadota bacterium]